MFVQDGGRGAYSAPFTPPCVRCVENPDPKPPPKIALESRRSSRSLLRTSDEMLLLVFKAAAPCNQ
jgi:hypothetical protein